MNEFNLDEKVNVLGKNVSGKIAYIGKTHFSEGEWFGIILDEEKGRNNGSVDGKSYFKCPRNRGIFVRACQLEKYGNLLNNYSMSKMTYPNYLVHSSRKTGNTGNIYDKFKESEIKTKKEIPDILPQPVTAADAEDIGDASRDDLEELKHQSMAVMENELRKMSEKLCNAVMQENYLRSELILAQKAVSFYKKKLRKTEKDLEISEKKKGELEEEIAGLREIAEAAVIEKEIAEERIEYFETVVEDECKISKNLELEIEILKEEMETQTDNGVPALHRLKKLENKNAVLNNALLSLSDLYHSLQEKLQKAEKAAEVRSAEIISLLEIEKHTEKNISKLKEETAEICEEIDNMLDVDDLVFEVTARNLSHEEKVRHLVDRVQVIEDEMEVSEEIEETLQEIKSICREEIECLESKLKHTRTALSENAELLKNKEGIIGKYGELIAVLKEKNRNISQELETALREKKEAIVSAENLKLKTGAGNRKSMNDLIQTEILKIDLNSMKRELSCWSLFMPENFFAREGENSAIQVKLITGKILEKLKFLIMHLQSFLFECFEKSPTELPSLGIGTKFLIRAYELECLLKIYDKSFDQMDVTCFLEQGRHQYIMTQTDSEIRSYLLLLCNREMDRKCCLENLKNTYGSLAAILNCKFVPKYEKTMAHVEHFSNIIQVGSKYIATYCSAADTIDALPSDHRLKVKQASNIAQCLKKTAGWLLSYIKNSREENLCSAPTVAENMKVFSKSAQEVFDYFLSIYSVVHENAILGTPLIGHENESFSKVISTMEKINTELEDLKIAVKNGDFFIECGIQLKHLSPIDALAQLKKEEREAAISDLVNKVASCELEIMSLTERLQKQRKCDCPARVKVLRDASQQTDEMEEINKYVKSKGDCSATTDYSMLQLQDMECSMFLNQENFQEHHSSLVPLRMLPKPELYGIQERLNTVAGRLRGMMVPLVIDVTKKHKNKERAYKKYLSDRTLILKEIEDELWNIKVEVKNL